MALFGEKYGEWVRVVEVDGVSRELCGGTHVANTAEIGIFKIASEGSSAANVRRIEALSGPAAIDWFREREQRLREVGELLGSPQDPLAGARRAAERLREAGKGAEQAEKQLLGEEAERLVAEATEVDGIEAGRLGEPRSPTRSSCSSSPTGCSRSSAGTSAVALGGAEDDKVALVVLVSKGAVERGLSAAAIVREAAPDRRRWRGRSRRHGPGRAARTRASSTRRWRRRGGDREGAGLSRVRVLALDHGTARIGCAISDPSGTLATPLPVIEPPEPRSVAELVAEHEVERVVVGLPLHLSGEEGSQAALARTFCAELEGMLDVPVETYDERLTTRMAEASKREGATAAPDSLAAAHLLQAYLAGRAAIEERRGR